MLTSCLGIVLNFSGFFPAFPGFPIYACFVMNNRQTPTLEIEQRTRFPDGSSKATRFHSRKCRRALSAPELKTGFDSISRAHLARKT
jgi:hypothetical protein